MTLTVTMNHPDYPKGEEFDLSGVGMIKNGESFTIEDDVIKRNDDANGYSLEKSLSDDPMFEVKSGSTTTTKKGGDS
jgi:hypothetical protein